ncbi:MAG: 50S ribosomal protein L33 [Candidatus Dojkabacteria bacterium]|nr:50S ribosomal protein L33 [Candidatus Dojkabacteria bacterium]
MAKNDTRLIVALRCQVCKNKNYTTYKNKKLQDKLSSKKYCPVCTAHTQHEETKLK